MPLVIYTNNFSNTAQSNLNTNRGMLQTYIERLSSGLRINRASDDAAGLSIGARMRADVLGMNQAARNANDGVGLLNIAEGAMSRRSNIPIRMRGLASQSARATVSDADRVPVQTEFDALRSETDRSAFSPRPTTVLTQTRRPA